MNFAYLPISRMKTDVLLLSTLQWKCDATGVTENLWLNLSTGFIGSGRPVRD